MLEKHCTSNIPRAKIGGVPRTADLLYPTTLPHFDEIAAGGHVDPRALAYTIRLFDLHSKRPFSVSDLMGLDFGGNSKAYRLLVKRGFVKEIDRALALAELYWKDELKELARSRGLPVGGTKEVLAARLLADGYKIDAKKRPKKLFALTESGVDLLASRRSDERAAILSATLALKDADYSGAISAYREYDSRWGFVHASGKNHTIFANFDLPFSRFDFISSYSMAELHNSEDFRATLRGCLMAGLMRGDQDRMTLAEVFKEACPEQIVCPNITRYFNMSSFEDAEARAIRIAMEENARSDSNYVLEYYISRVLYLSRHLQ